MKRLSPDAYVYHVDLGAARSYEAVAKKFGVSKVTVVNHAAKERWQERLREAEQKAREEANTKAVDVLQEVKDRQLMEARILEHRALDALKTLPPDKAAKAAMMLQIAWRHELLLLGEPTERQANTIEEITRREIQTLLTVDDEEEAADPEPAPEVSHEAAIQPLSSDDGPPPLVPEREEDDGSDWIA